MAPTSSNSLSPWLFLTGSLRRPRLLRDGCLIFQRRKDAHLHRLQRISSIENAFPNSPLSKNLRDQGFDEGEESITEKILTEYQMGLESFQPAIPDPIYQRYLPKATSSLKPLRLASIHSQDTASVYSVASAAWYLPEDIVDKQLNERSRYPLPHRMYLAAASSREVDTFQPPKLPTMRRKLDSRPFTVTRKLSNSKRKTNWRRSGEGLKLVARKKLRPLRVVNRGPTPSMESSNSSARPSGVRIQAAHGATKHNWKRSLSSSWSFPPPSW
ncbi:hypothetical protein CPB83DRAFT_910220 [Crepidotus variabilis]|uniref:Uncharacterized protein n=1 Tax=Crepidotus variabilis TaxID=179855 RepID=A0A9P6E7C5_9AGAR|nr:hypothetical protein CPB83DRAFT_910220 [Crepidotus variabilis]